MKCGECASLSTNVRWRRGDLGDAKGKFIRRQTEETHTALVAAKAGLKEAQAALDAHTSKCGHGLAENNLATTRRKG